MINRSRKDISTNPKHTLHRSVTQHERWMILDQNSLKGKDYPFRLSLMEFVRKKNVSNSDEYTVQRDSIYPRWVGPSLILPQFNEPPYSIPINPISSYFISVNFSYDTNELKEGNFAFLLGWADTNGKSCFI